MYFTRYALLATVSASAVLLSSAAYSLPQGGAVSAGNASITSTGTTAIITQGSDRAVIDWKSFNVGTGEAVTFQQPSAASVTLNRIHDQKPSEIMGSIKANGQVILSNPSGMVFGKDSKVDVAGLVATTASISNDAFMNGGPLKLSIPGKTDAKIIANGSISAKDAGLVALVAPNVEQNGLIAAKLGKVQLAGAEIATVDLYGDGLVSIAVSDTKFTSVTHTGTITASHVALTAADAASLIDSTVNVDSIIDANDARQNQDGSLTFGGRIEVTARDVGLESGARLRAAGKDGGGIVKVGGGWQGKGTITNAKNTTMKPGARINASATGKGDGGIVAVWADGTTQFGGSILAKGGPKGGNGGNVETSGKQQLGVSGSVDASALRGKAGEWLLDPRNVIISGGGAYSVNAAGETVIPGSDDFTILDSSISTALSNGNNVTITTGSTGIQTGNISFNNATIAKTGGGDTTLTFKAEGSITTSGTNSISSNSGKLHTIFWVDAEAVPNNDGMIALNNFTINTQGGDAVFGGGRDNGADIISVIDGTTILYDGIAGDGRPDEYAWGNATVDEGVVFNNVDVLTGAGSILMRGHGRNAGTGTQIGVYIYNTSLVKSDSNFILLDGIGGTGGNSNHGVGLSDANTILRSTTGNITLNGLGGPSTGDFNYGVYMQSSATVDSDGTGASAAPITLLGKGNTAGASNNNYGVTFSAITLSTKDGDIDVKAIAGNGTSSNNGLRIFSSALTANGDANLTFTATRGSGGGDFDIGGGTTTIGGSNATGTITFNADNISNFNNATVQTQNNIIFKPRTSTLSIGISGGTCGGSCNLPISDSTLAQLNPDVDGDGVGSLIIGNSAAGTGTVDINGWDLSGKTYNVEVYGGTVDLTGGPVTWNGGNDILFHSRTGNLIIDQNFTKSGGAASTLTLKAAGSVYNVGTPSITSSSAALNTILWSNAGNTNSGAVILDGTTVTTSGGDLYIGGGLDDGSNGGIASDGRPDGDAWGVNAAVPTRVGIKINNSSVITTGSGSVTLRGHGSNDGTLASNMGINLADISITSSGGITMNGVGGTGTTGNAGIYLSNATVQAAGSGGINLTGIGNGLGSANVGVHLISGASILSDNGDIHINGTGGSTGTTGSNIGVVVSATGSNRIQSGTGDITIIGYGMGSGGSSSGVTFGSALGITSSGGDISITGTGSTTDTDSNNYGINSAGPLSTTGTGTITLNGTGGGTGGASNNNYGYVLQTGATVSTVSGTIDITGIGGTGTGNFGFFTDSNAGNRIGTSGTTTGNITITADRMNVGANNIYTSGDITLKALTAGRAFNIAGGSGGLDIGTALLNGLNGGNVIIGDAASGLITVNPYASWASRASSGVSFLSGTGGISFAAGGAHDFGTRSLTATTAGPLAVNDAIIAGTALLHTTGATSDITFGAAGGITASGSGDPLILSAGRNFINNRGAAALSAPSGRWLVYSTDPTQDTNGGLVADFTRNGCAYPGCTGFTPGLNGFLYRVAGLQTGSGGTTPIPPATPPVQPVPPVSEPGGQPAVPSAPISDGSFFDFIRNQDLATRIQVGGAFQDSFNSLTTSDLFLSERDIENDLSTASIESTDNSMRADDRRRRWSDGALYSFSPELIRALGESGE